MYHRLPNAAAAEPVRWLLSDGQRGAPNWPADLNGWKVFVDYVEANGLGSVVARWIVGCNVRIPQQVLERLDNIDAQILEKATRARQQATIIDDALRLEQIPMYWLKGAAWGQCLYAELGTRPMRDLDFVVPRGYVDRAFDVLQNLGYKTESHASAAGQHLPRMEHRPSGTKVDLHHRIVPTSIYGFQVSDPDVPWSSSNGVMSGTAKDIDVRFHVAHMIIHIFHHLFYNLRLMHLFDLKLALAAWQLQAAEVIEMASGFMPRRIVVDILSLVDALFAGAPGLPHDLDSNTVNGFVRNGSIPLLYPLRRVDHPSELTAVVAAEISRGWFVLRFMPGRFGRPTAPLHPSR